MNQTSNYQLNQWDSDDRILRTDFNSDNAKIDAALASRLGAAEVLQQFTITNQSDLETVVLDFSALDWREWSFLIIEFRGNFASYADQYVLYFNFPGVGFNLYPGSTEENRPKSHSIVLMPFRDQDRLAQMLYFPGGKLATSTYPYSALTSAKLYISSSNVLAYMSGTGSLTLYGIR